MKIMTLTHAKLLFIQVQCRVETTTRIINQSINQSINQNKRCARSLIQQHCRHFGLDFVLVLLRALLPARRVMAG